MSDTTKPVTPPPEPTSRPEQMQNTVVRDAIATFKSLGWSEIASVALVANLMWESGGNVFGGINFQARGDRDKDGIYRSHGAGQWNERAGRFKLLQDYATRRGKDWTDPETQILFLDHELNTRPYSKFGAPLREAKTIEEAMDWTIKIWGPSIPHTEKRLAIAKKLMGAL